MQALQPQERQPNKFALESHELGFEALEIRNVNAHAIEQLPTKSKTCRGPWPVLVANKAPAAMEQQ